MINVYLYIYNTQGINKCISHKYLKVYYASYHASYLSSKYTHTN